MILLALNWEEQITKQFKEHKKGKTYGRQGCACMKCRCGVTAAQQIKALNKEIQAGRARVTETLAVDTLLMNGGLE